MIIWNDNLERWLKEKDREQASIQKMETEFCSITQIKETILNIGKTRNKRKKKQSKLDQFIDEDYTKLLCLKINKNIDEIAKSSLYNDYKEIIDIEIHRFYIQQVAGRFTDYHLIRLTEYMNDYIVNMKRKL
jgi:hypothetical protein